MAKHKTKRTRPTGMAAAMAVKPKPNPAAKKDDEAIALLAALIKNSRDINSQGKTILALVIKRLKA